MFLSSHRFYSSAGTILWCYSSCLNKELLSAWHAMLLFAIVLIITIIMKTMWSSTSGAAGPAWACTDRQTDRQTKTMSLILSSIKSYFTMYLLPLSSAFAALSHPVAKQNSQYVNHGLNLCSYNLQLLWDVFCRGLHKTLNLSAGFYVNLCRTSEDKFCSQQISNYPLNETYFHFNSCSICYTNVGVHAGQHRVMGWEEQ